MKHIISRTLETTLKKVYLIIIILIGLGCALVEGLVIKDAGIGGFDGIFSGALIVQTCLVFFVFGATLTALSIDCSTGLIANEVHEGTFRLLVAKPNTRSQILSAKIIGTYLGELLLALLILGVYFGVLCFQGGIDGHIIEKLTSYFVSYFLYFAFLLFIVTGVSTLLSTICKKKIVAFLPMIALMIITIAFFPIQRVVADLSGTIPPTTISFVDTNYHFALIFGKITNFTTALSANSGNVAVLTYLMNLYRILRVDADIALAQYSSLAVVNDTLNANVVLVVYLMMGTLSYALSYLVIRKKDV